MRFPEPADMTPLAWRNYVIAQLVQATLGLIPEHALAVGVTVHRDGVVVQFQLSEADQDDEEDMRDIVDELVDLLGEVVEVSSEAVVRMQPQLSPTDGICWVWRVHVARAENTSG